MSTALQKAIRNYQVYLQENIDEVTKDRVLEEAYKQGLLTGYRSALLRLFKTIPGLDDQSKDSHK